MSRPAAIPGALLACAIAVAGCGGATTTPEEPGAKDVAEAKDAAEAKDVAAGEGGTLLHIPAPSDDATIQIPDVATGPDICREQYTRRPECDDHCAACPANVVDRQLGCETGQSCMTDHSCIGPTICVCVENQWCCTFGTNAC